jgi:putative phosphoribosyl transferase
VEPFRDRADAGRRLGAVLAGSAWAGPHAPAPVVVLGLPRGGVPVAAEVARALSAPLDVFLVRKLGAPGRPELAMGAIAPGGVRVVNAEVVRLLAVTPSQIDTVAEREESELERRLRAYRPARPPVDLAGSTAVLVDDGLATGATMRAAVEGARQADPAWIVVGVPVGSPEGCNRLRGPGLADEVVCLVAPADLGAVGAWYADFTQVSDEEVRSLLSPLS